MKRFILSFFILLVFVACSRPKIIPDEKLARIFHDIYLTNAYVNNYGMGNADSVSIYEPVFVRHGYTPRDVQYTIGNFAKRKSARVGDVVDLAIRMLADENSFFAGRIAIQDTLALIAQERYSTLVRRDSLIRIARIRDTSRLRFTIPVEADGGYTVNYDYYLDSADHNTNLAFRHYILAGDNRRMQNNLRRPKTLAREHISLSFTVNPDDKALVLDLNGYGKDMTTPHLTIENLVVKHHPDRQLALDSMARSLFEDLYSY